MGKAIREQRLAMLESLREARPEPVAPKLTELRDGAREWCLLACRLTGVRQSDLSSGIGMSQGAVSNFLRGTQEFSNKSLEAVVAWLDGKMESMVRDAKTMTTKKGVKDE